MFVYVQWIPFTPIASIQLLLFTGYYSYFTCLYINSFVSIVAAAVVVVLFSFISICAFSSHLFFQLSRQRISIDSINFFIHILYLPYFVIPSGNEIHLTISAYICDIPNDWWKIQFNSFTHSPQSVICSSSSFIHRLNWYYYYYYIVKIAQKEEIHWSLNRFFYFGLNNVCICLLFCSVIQFFLLLFLYVCTAAATATAAWWWCCLMMV